MDTVTPRVAHEKYQINKIHILRSDAYCEKRIENPKDIVKILGLIEKVKKSAEIYPHFIESPQLRTFRVELYQDEVLILRIAIAGNFVTLYGEWHFMKDLSFKKELMRCTKDVLCR